MIEDGNKKPADAETAQAQELLLIGTSMGGARPKAVVEDADGLWLAKFNTPYDRWNAARVEQAMLTLGRACGLTVADSRVTGIGGRDAGQAPRSYRKPRREFQLWRQAEEIMARPIF